MPWPLSANLSMLFTDVPLPERVQVAAEHGFDGVEIQFPYALPAAELASALELTGMPLVLMNVPAGDLLQGGTGLAGVPGQHDMFARAVDQALAYAAIVRPQRVNVLPGRLADGYSREAALDTLAVNLTAAADAFGTMGIKVVCEAINRVDMPGFLLATGAELAQMIERVDHPNLFAQLDFYHMQRMGESLPGVIERLGARIGHVQFADAPGRGAPGSGVIDFAAAFRVLEACHYAGWLGAEYRPLEDGGDSLEWMARWREAGHITPRARSV